MTGKTHLWKCKKKKNKVKNPRHILCIAILFDKEIKIGPKVAAAILNDYQINISIKIILKNPEYFGF